MSGETVPQLGNDHREEVIMLHPPVEREEQPQSADERSPGPGLLCMKCSLEQLHLYMPSAGKRRQSQPGKFPGVGGWGDSSKTIRPGPCPAAASLASACLQWPPEKHSCDGHAREWCPSDVFVTVHAVPQRLSPAAGAKREPAECLQSKGATVVVRPLQLPPASRPDTAFGLR